MPYRVFTDVACGAAALVIAHPAHELRLFGWMARRRPVVEVLTTGSRRGASCARLLRCGDLVDAAGAARGGLFGAVHDGEFYRLVMDADAAVFAAWVDLVAADLVAADVQLVVVDAWQGYSPAHDLTHLVGRLAALRAAARLGHPVEVAEYITAPVEISSMKPESRLLWTLRLNADEIAAKRTALAAYPDIAGETAEIFAIEGPGCLEMERLFSPPPFAALLRPEPDGAFYEKLGRQRVEAGHYASVLCESHVRVIAGALIGQDAEAGPMRAAGRR